MHTFQQKIIIFDSLTCALREQVSFSQKINTWLINLFVLLLRGMLATLSFEHSL